MKVVALLSLALLLLGLIVPVTTASKKKQKVPNKYSCNKTLMDSYDIEGSWYPVPEKNAMCPMANKRNCCNYHAQLDIYKKWFMQGERKKILELYKTYTNALGNTLN